MFLFTTLGMCYSFYRIFMELFTPFSDANDCIKPSVMNRRQSEREPYKQFYEQVHMFRSGSLYALFLNKKFLNTAARIVRVKSSVPIKYLTVTNQT